MRSNRVSSLVNGHFVFVLFLNFFLFAVYQIFRLYMSFVLMARENLNFFTGHLVLHEEGWPYYTLNRIYLPVYFVIIFLVLYKLFFRELNSKLFLSYFSKLLSIFRLTVKKYLIFLAFAFSLLSLMPGFLLLLKHPTTQYGLMDADSYISLIQIMYYHDFNAKYVPDSGLQFSKYYMITIPSLFLTYILGPGQMVAAYNMTITFFVFFIILNIVFTFNVIFADCEKDTLKEEIKRLVFIGGFTIIFLCLVVFREYFNFNSFLVNYCSGYYGAIGGSFLLSSFMFVISYLFKERKIILSRLHQIFFTTLLFQSFMIQGYFHMVLFLLPITGLVLSFILSKKLDPKVNFKLTILFFVFLFVTYFSYLALDILPRYNLNPVGKLQLIITGLTVAYFFFLAINRFKNDLIFNWFLKLKYFFLIIIFFSPLLAYLIFSRDNYRIEFLGLPLILGEVRTYLISLLLVILVLASIFYLLLKRLLFETRPKLVWPITLAIFILSCLIGFFYEPRKYLPLRYPDFYPELMRDMDLANEYVFDKNGVRVTYNKYLVNVTQFFVQTGIKDAYFWLASQKSSLDIYDHGIMERTLLRTGHEFRGETVRDVKDLGDKISKLDDMLGEGKTSINGNLFLIADNYFPKEVVSKISHSPWFKLVYQNKLYQVYQIGR